MISSTSTAHRMPAGPMHCDGRRPVANPLEAADKADEVAHEPKSEQGYHFRVIAKGELGAPSKIREELEELEDALQQNNKILALVEMSDIYGALEMVAERLGATMADLASMSEATKRAFRNGSRK